MAARPRHHLLAEPPPVIADVVEIRVDEDAGIPQDPAVWERVFELGECVRVARELGPEADLASGA